MHGYLEDEKTSLRLFVGLWIIYMLICLNKNTYAAAIASIVDVGLFDKSAAGIINASYYLLYGGAQLFLSRLTDKIPPWNMLFFGLCSAVVINLVMATTRSFSVMLTAWTMGGLLQFGVWPATLKIIATVLNHQHRKKAAIYISICLCTGSVLSYFSAMLLLKKWSWPSLFFFTASLLFLATIAWYILIRRTKKKLVHRQGEPVQAAEVPEKQAEKPNLFRLFLISGFAIMLIPSITRCMLDQGVKSWVPTMMMETFGITADTASLIAMLVTLINASGVFLSSRLTQKWKNPVLISAVLFAATGPTCALLLLITHLPVWFVALLLILTTTASYGINQLLIVDMPTAFEKYNCIGTVTSICNAFASFGVMLGNFSFGFLADLYGWNAVIITWLLLGLLSVVCCLVALPMWKRFTAKA